MNKKGDFNASLKEITDLLEANGHPQEAEALRSKLYATITAAGVAPEHKDAMYVGGAEMLQTAHFVLQQTITNTPPAEQKAKIKKMTESLLETFSGYVISLAPGGGPYLQ